MDATRTVQRFVTSLDREDFAAAAACLGPGRWRVRYIDLTEHAGRRHRHECEQVLWTDASGLVGRIEHADLPGERERLDAFLRAVGVTRPAG